jgi:hypothetical protein
MVFNIKPLFNSVILHYEKIADNLREHYHGQED